MMVGGVEAKEVDIRICFGIAWFETEEEANTADKAIRKEGVTYNGGFFHGMPCGRDKSWDCEKGFAVTF